jgi:hypothetical protein
MYFLVEFLSFRIAMTLVRFIPQHLEKVSSSPSNNYFLETPQRSQSGAV